MERGPEGVPIKGWTRGVPVDGGAIEQLQNVSKLPFVFKHVAVMPDVHVGMGATIGSVIATKGAIIPAAVGVDIGCGMVAVRTGLDRGDIPANVKPWYRAIEDAVPHGFGKKGSHFQGGWNPNDTPGASVSIWKNLLEEFDAIIYDHPKLVGANTYNHLGTLGSGNHFIELCLDKTDRVWIMLHSGSRGIGNRIGTYFTKLAKAEMRKYHITLPDPHLAYFPQGTKYFDNYMRAMNWALKFARNNRDLMVAQVIEGLKKVPGVPQHKLCTLDEVINCHHNYAAWENHYGENVIVTRKGAVNAREGRLGIIPGNMSSESYIVAGKGNKDSFESCSHGAGRVMSRTEAKKQLTLEAHIESTKGVECKKDISMLDESDGAYKRIDAVMAAQTDLVEVKHVLKGFVCVKG
jgi:tRNA-splicing ligase RtcB